MICYFLIIRQTSTTENSSNRSIWGDRYIKRILANISLRIDNMVIKYDHDNLHTVLSSKVLLVIHYIID